MMEMVVSTGDNWSYKSCKAPVKSSPPTNLRWFCLRDGSKLEAHSIGERPRGEDGGRRPRL